MIPQMCLFLLVVLLLFAWVVCAQEQSCVPYGKAGIGRKANSEGFGEAAQTWEPFELYDDFSIEEQILRTDPEWWKICSWWDIIDLRTREQAPIGLTFYEDKVALKRWLMTKGFDIPPFFALHYASELGDGRKDTILNLLPTTSSYVAKPSNTAESSAVWIVNQDPDIDDTVRVSSLSNPYEEILNFSHTTVADSLAHYVSGYDDPDSWKNRNVIRLRVKPGLIVEEIIASWETGYHKCDRADESFPLEFKVFTIWGRVWIAEWRCGRFRSSWEPGYIHRNGTMVAGSHMKSIPKWVDWSRIVDIAERLGANKDMFRVDIFAGAPAGSPSLRKEATEEERKGAVRYMVNEVSTSPATWIPPELAVEGESLWKAGYNSGNYRIVPNADLSTELLQMYHEKHASNEMK